MGRREAVGTMIRVAMIGAGSIGFTRRMMMDILAVPELVGTEFRLMDINAEALEMSASLCRKMIDDAHLPATVVATPDRREALRDADFVFSFVRVGGLEAFAHDIEIPLKYGVDQCVGDTLGPGGIFYALRTIPVLVGIAKDMEDVCPRALLLNYSNPMAMNCWGVRRASKTPMVGLCHGVQGAHWQIALALGLPVEEVEFVAAGLNHQTWFIQVRHKGKDMLPFVLDAFERNESLAHSEAVRIDVMRRFGYYSTESNGHLSEYLMWYRKRPQELKSRWICPDTWIGGRTGGYLEECRKTADHYRQMYPKWLSGEADAIRLGDRSSEHGSYIVEALVTGRRYRGHFNVENTGLITNIPNGCTIEIPCMVDANGIAPTYIGDLPLGCAAILRQTISVQELTVEAALTGDKELVRQALALDPLTGSVCNLDEVWAMADEMLEALSPWLPQFAEGRQSPRRAPQPGLRMTRPIGSPPGSATVDAAGALEKTFALRGGGDRG
ncbi:MAG TPA: alpha-glucosidase/alpha-galactosidase [Armatimonadota bacterium]|nr:alpha-glucosidase/alpha-galactosidase [Armatimonadota bacterium]HQK94253.1 alpha-glucosidase/alpha-galactosidase [Armatimonadota bacterium]